jgi:ParB-like chromosome segregation protein Spo0J
MQKIEIIKSKLIPVSSIEGNKGQIDGLPKNPRLIKDAKFEKLKKSIEDNPEMLGARELIVYPYNDKFVIIGGNMRYTACKELGYKELPCKVLPADYSPEQLRAITIKDNVAFGENDWENLANEWDAQELEEWGMDVPNFIDNLTNNEDYEGLDHLSKLDKFMNSELKRMFLVYENETFERVVKWFEIKQLKYNIEDNSLVILKIMELENV